MFGHRDYTRSFRERFAIERAEGSTSRSLFSSFSSRVHFIFVMHFYSRLTSFSKVFIHRVLSVFFFFYSLSLNSFSTRRTILKFNFPSPFSLLVSFLLYMVNSNTTRGKQIPPGRNLDRFDISRFYGTARTR